MVFYDSLFSIQCFVWLGFGVFRTSARQQCLFGVDTDFSEGSGYYIV